MAEKFFKIEKESKEFAFDGGEIEYEKWIEELEDLKKKFEEYKKKIEEKDILEFSLEEFDNLSNYWKSLIKNLTEKENFLKNNLDRFERESIERRIRINLIANPVLGKENINELEAQLMEKQKEFGEEPDEIRVLEMIKKIDEKTLKEMYFEYLINKENNFKNRINEMLLVFRADQYQKEKKKKEK